MTYLHNDLIQHDWFHQNSVSCESCGQDRPGNQLQGDAFEYYVITQLQADKLTKQTTVN